MKGNSFLLSLFLLYTNQITNTRDIINKCLASPLSCCKNILEPLIMIMNDFCLRHSRYGREDEELMGLRFCNEVIVAAEQIYPTPIEEATDSEANAGSPRRASTSRRNSTLVNNQGFVAVPFVVDMGSAAPPSIRLIPCRPYNGAPIGEHFFTLFKNYSKCRIWIVAFSTNFFLIKTHLSGNTFWLQALGFQKLAKLSIFWHF